MGLIVTNLNFQRKKKIKNPTIGERRRWGQSGVKKQKRWGEWRETGVLKKKYTKKSENE
jgi:hypothetical protein